MYTSTVYLMLTQGTLIWSIQYNIDVAMRMLSKL